MEKKYKLTNESAEHNGKTLYKIIALKSFKTDSGTEIPAGEYGGWIESEKNLSQEGTCWVFRNAKVYGDAKVFGNARVFGQAEVSEAAQISGHANVYGDATISGNARISDNAYIYGSAQVYGNATISGDTKVYGYANVYDNAAIYGSAKIYGNGYVYGNARVSGQAEVTDAAQVYGNAMITGSSWISDCAEVRGNAKIEGGRVYADMVIPENVLSLETKDIPQEPAIAGTELHAGDQGIYSSGRINRPPAKIITAEKLLENFDMTNPLHVNAIKDIVSKLSGPLKSSIIEKNINTDIHRNIGR